MKTKYPIYIAFAMLIIGSAFFAASASAQEDDSNIQYPVQELGGCKDREECHAFCEKPGNKVLCLEFAQKNNLMSQAEVDKAKKFLDAGESGPDGCKGQEACEVYCNDSSHIDECISYAEKNNLMSSEELTEAKKVQAAIASGIKPPPCGGKKGCDVYCEDPNHMEECINFASQAGLMSKQEQADAQKMLKAIKNGVKPPPCRGKEECDKYCQQDEHIEECVNFAAAAGFMDPKDVEMSKKTKGKGPGGCRGKEECDKFCQEHEEECVKFAQDNGLVSPEDQQRMQEDRQKMKDPLQNMPAEVSDCLGSDVIEKIKNGEVSRQLGEKMKTCFEKMGPPDQDKGDPDKQFKGGPGGCQSPKECDSYCKDHEEECKKFRPGPGETNPGGRIMPPQSGPRGCKGPKECLSFCEKNPEECKNIRPLAPNGEGGFKEGNKFCEGQDCKYDNPPVGQEQEGFRPKGEFDNNNFQRPDRQEPPAAQPQQPIEQQTPPPEPAASPVSKYINTDSLVGSLINVVFMSIFHR